jgi:hypothetical protein
MQLGRRALRRVVSLVGLAIALGGCASWMPASSIAVPGEVAGQWKGSMDGRLGRGPASLMVQENGRYEGQLHLTDGDRSFQGTIMTLGPRGGRYAGTDGEGSVTLRDEHGRAVLEFVRDGGGSRATFTRPQ